MKNQKKVKNSILPSSELKKPEFKPDKKTRKKKGRVDLGFFPLRTDSEPRVVYFTKLHPDDKKELVQRGYRPRYLFDMPRGEPQQEVEYLLAKAQAIEEGTVPGGMLEEKLLKLQMLANKMIGTKNTIARINVNLDKTDVKALLAGWGSSRHTLGGNTTIQEAQFLKEEPAKGKKK